MRENLARTLARHRHADARLAGEGVERGAAPFLGHAAIDRQRALGGGGCAQSQRGRGQRRGGQSEKSLHRFPRFVSAFRRYRGPLRHAERHRHRTPVSD